MSQHHVQVPAQTGQEKRLTNNEINLLQEGRQGLEGSIYNQNQILPYLLQQAGFDVTMGGGADPTQIKAAQDALASLGDVKGKDRKALRQEYGAKKGKLKRAIENKIGQLQSQAPTIQSIKPNAARAQEMANENAILGTIDERTKQALSGNLPDILSGMPEVQRQLERERAIAEERVRRQLGTGGEISTPGEQALNDFSKYSLEAVGNQARQNVGLYSGLSMAGHQGSLQNAGARQQLSAFPVAMQQQGAMNMGQYAQGYNPLLNYYNQRAGLQMQGNMFNASQPTGLDMTLKTIGSLTSGLRGPMGGGGGGS